MKSKHLLLVAYFALLTTVSSSAQNTPTISSPSQPTSPSGWLDYARNMYFVFGTEDCPQQTLFNYLQSIDVQDNSLFNAYKSVSELTSSECIDGLFSKLAAWNKAKPIFDSIVAANPENAEIHFLQLGVAIHAPSLVDYSSFVNPDENVLVTGIIQNPNVFDDKAFTAKVINWIFKHIDNLTAQQQSQLEAIEEKLTQ